MTFEGRRSQRQVRMSSSTESHFPHSEALPFRLRNGREVLMTYVFGNAGDRDKAYVVDPRSLSLLLSSPVRHVVYGRELLHSNVSKTKPSVFKECTTKHIRTVDKKVRDIDLDIQPLLLRPSFYPPVDYNLTVERNAQRDRLCMSTPIRQVPTICLRAEY